MMVLECAKEVGIYYTKAYKQSVTVGHGDEKKIRKGIKCRRRRPVSGFYYYIMSFKLP